MSSFNICKNNRPLERESQSAKGTEDQKMLCPAQACEELQGTENHPLWVLANTPLHLPYHSSSCHPLEAGSLQ